MKEKNCNDEREEGGKSNYERAVKKEGGGSRMKNTRGGKIKNAKNMKGMSGIIF